MSPRAALFADIREPPSFPSLLPSGLNGASRGSSIGGGNPSNVPVGLCQSAFQKRRMLHSAFGKFILAGSGGASDQTVASPSPPPLSIGGGGWSLFDFLEEWERGEGRGTNKGRSRPRNCEKSSLRTISVRGFYPFPCSYPYLVRCRSNFLRKLESKDNTWNGRNIRHVNEITLQEGSKFSPKLIYP